MVTTSPVMTRVAIFLALLAQLQPALAAFWTVTSYFAISSTISSRPAGCTTSCRYYTSSTTLSVQPTATPTASPISSRTTTNTYDDVEVVYLYVPVTAVASSDIITTTTYASNLYTAYVVPITWTAPSSCPTPFIVETITRVLVPYQVTPYISAVTTATHITTDTYDDSTRTKTYLTYFLDPKALPSSALADPDDNYYYSYYIEDCRNPTATGAAYWGPGYDDDDDDDYGGSRSGGSDWDNYTVCSVMTGCVRLRTWVIVVATIIPTIFVLGFIESYCWFRRMMLGKSALRLGTVCWCCMSLWFILLTRKSVARSKEDQMLLKQYWATLGFGQRVKFWLKWGFRWKYPVELLGNPEGRNPVVVVQQGAPMPPGAPGQDGGNGTEKTPGITQQQQPVWVPYSAGQQSVYYQPSPDQQLSPEVVQQGGYMMPVPPQAAYMTGQPGQTGFFPIPTPPPAGDGQQQAYPYVPSPSPAQTATTGWSSMHHTPSPVHEQQQQPPGQQQQQQPPH
ncbi:hypothetical protein N0V88_008104 [Collariella sp. IMI 366227]|nr:hypothetical protein N0V88_008104 [Collariella sp. IMI 366227]